MSQEKYPEWFIQEKRILQSIITNTSYPCYFAREAEKKNENIYMYMDSASYDDDLIKISNELAIYLDNVKSNDKLIRSSFIVLIKPCNMNSNLTFKEYERMFWDFLIDLNKVDKSEWPSAITSNSNSASWEFCFNNEPLFILGTSPKYKNRKSRAITNNCLAVIIQSKKVFDGLNGSVAKKIIRDKVKNYDHIPVHFFLGNEYKSSTYKWKQYFIPDDDSEINECPFHKRKED